MNILYLDHAPILGGAQVALLNLIAGLERSRWQPMVATTDNARFRTALASQGVEVVTVPFGRLNRSGLAAPVHLAQAVRAVTHAVRRHNIRLLHSNTVRAHIVAAVAGRICGTPVIWTLHDNTFPLALLRLLAPMPRAVITVSGWLATLYGQYGLARKAHVILNGLDLGKPLVSPDGLRQELGILAAAPLAVWVGRLVEGKAPHLFVQAAHIVSGAVPDSRFVLVGGPDPLEPKQKPTDYAGVLSSVVKQCGLGDRLVMAGYRQDVERFYAAADVVAYTSVSPEGLPTVLLEAMRYGKPVVASATGGAAEIVRDGETGLLTWPGRVEELAEAITLLLHEPVYGARLGIAGGARLRTEFDLHVQVASTEAVYARVLGI